MCLRLPVESLGLTLYGCVCRMVWPVANSSGARRSAASTTKPVAVPPFLEKSGAGRRETTFRREPSATFLCTLIFLFGRRRRNIP